MFYKFVIVFEIFVIGEIFLGIDMIFKRLFLGGKVEGSDYCFFIV